MILVETKRVITDLSALLLLASELLFLKRVLVLVGVMILIIGGYLLYSPAAYGSVASFSGLYGSKITYDQNSALEVRSSNYSFVSIALTPRDNLTARIQADSPGVNFLLMNAGNFSEFRQSGSGTYSVYPQSNLSLRDYSFNFVPTAPNQTYYLVFTPVSPNTTTTVLAHLTVLTNTSVSGSEYVPILIIVIGLALLGIGLNVGKKKPEAKVVKVAPTRPQVQTTCKFCNATLNPSSSYCPSCGKSQV